MITRKEALGKIEESISKIKQMFSEQEQKVVVVPQKFDDVTLQDGSIVQVDVLAVNGKVTANDLPVADGSYTLQDGTTIEVLGGVITELSAPADQEPTEVEVDMSTPDKMKVACQKFATATPEQQQAMLLAVMNYCFGWQMKKEQEDAQVKAAIDAYKAVNEGTTTALKEVAQTMEQTFSLVKEIGNEPIETPKTIIEPLTAFQKFQAEKRNV